VKLHKYINNKGNKMYRVQRLLTYIVLSIILLSGVYAFTPIPNATAYYSFDDIATVGSILKDIRGDYNVSLINSPTTGVAGISNQSYFFNRNLSNYLQIVTQSDNVSPRNSKNFSVNVWIKPTSYCINANCDIVGWRTGSNIPYGLLRLQDPNQPRWNERDSSSINLYSSNAVTETLVNKWSMITVTRNEQTGNISMYIDGRLNSSTVTTLQDIDGQLFKVGYMGTDPNYFEGNMDELAIFQDIELSEAEVNALYKNGTGVFCSGDPCVFPSSDSPPIVLVNNFTINAKFRQNNNSININGLYYNLYFENSTIQRFYPKSPPNTTVITPYLVNETKLINIEGVLNSSFSTYFLNTYLSNHNTSQNVDLFFIISEIRVNTFDKFNNQVIGNISFSTIGAPDSSFDIGVNKTNLEPFYISSAIYTIDFTKDGILKKYENNLVSNQENKTINLTDYYNSILNITLKDLFTDTKVKNFTASISDNGITYRKETTNGSILFEVTKGSEYNLSVGSNEYVNTSVLYNVTGFNPIYNFTAYTERTINITLRDESTDSILTENMTVEILGDEIRKKTTTSGKLIFQLLAPDTYNIRYFSTNNLDYQLRQKSFTVLPNQIYNLDLYSLNTSANNVGVVNVLIYDNAYNKVLGADVRLTKQNSVTGQFEEVSQCNTNSDGLCSFTVILGAETYIITATDTINGNTFTGQNSQSGVIFYNDNAQITIRLNGEPNYQVNDYFDLVINVYNKSLVNNISYLSASYVNGAGATSRVCVEYFLQSGTTSNSLAKYCSTGSSGVIPTTVLLNRSYTNVVKVYALNDGTEQVYYTNIYTAEQSAQGYFGWMAKYLIFGVLILGLGIAVLLKQIILYPIFAVIGILVSWVVFPAFITIADVSIVILLGIGIVYLSTKNTGDNNV